MAVTIELAGDAACDVVVRAFESRIDYLMGYSLDQSDVAILRKLILDIRLQQAKESVDRLPV